MENVNARLARSPGFSFIKNPINVVALGRSSALL